MSRIPNRIPLGECGSATAPLKTAATWSRRLLLGTSLASCGSVIGLPALPEPVALGIAGAGFAVGVPHGAADHVIATRLIGDRSMVVVVVVYAGVAAAAWALLQWADPGALLLAIGLSALHFGLGELEVTRRLTGWQPTALATAAIVIVGSGALVLPLARRGDQWGAVAKTVSPDLASAIACTPVRAALFAGWLLAALVAIAGSLRAHHPAVAADIVIVGTVGLLAPPLIAFAVWFGGWHALRHCARLLAVEPGCAALLTAGHGAKAVVRLIRISALPTLAAWTVLAILVWVTVTATDPTVVIADVLRLLLALTVPHTLVVLWLDRANERLDHNRIDDQLVDD